MMGSVLSMGDGSFFNGRGVAWRSVVAAGLFGFCAPRRFWRPTRPWPPTARGNPNALGTSRTLVVDPRQHPRIGTMQYPETLPLADHEVVLTFDDGPLPKNSNKVLDILADECVKATFFTIGEQARASPEGVRKLLAAGHTIGTHTQTHPVEHESHADRARQAGDRRRHRVDESSARRQRRRAGAVLPDSGPAARRQCRGLSRPNRAFRSGAPISSPTTGTTFRPSASMISPSAGSRPRAKAFCCFMTSRHAPSPRCREFSRR